MGSECTTALSSVMTPHDLTLMARDLANLVKHSLKSNSVTSALFIEVVLPFVFVFFFFFCLIIFVFHISENILSVWGPAAEWSS